MFAKMQSVVLTSILGLSVAVVGLVVPPPPQDVINLAGGPPPTFPPLPSLSPAAIERLQLGLYLELLEADYFNSGLANISTWGLGGVPANVVDALGPIAAVSKIYLSSQLQCVCDANISLAARENSRIHSPNSPRLLQPIHPGTMQVHIPGILDTRIPRSRQLHRLRRLRFRHGSRSQSSHD